MRQATWPLFVGRLVAGAALVVRRARSLIPRRGALGRVPSEPALCRPRGTQFVYLGRSQPSPLGRPPAAAPLRRLPPASERALPSTRAIAKRTPARSREVGGPSTPRARRRAVTRGAQDLASGLGRRPDIKDVAFLPLECRKDCWLTARPRNPTRTRSTVADDGLPASEEFPALSGGKFTKRP